MPIDAFDVQYRYRELGRLRMGEKGPKGEPRKRETWRLTSRIKDLVEHAAELYDGVVKPFSDDQWEADTKAKELDVLLPPQEMTRSQWFELWSGTGCLRRCDGKQEVISDEPCLCKSENNSVCAPTTHLLVMLPRIPDIGVWRLVTHGWNAASELPGTVDLLQRIYGSGFLARASLGIEQRRSGQGKQTKRFAVPILRIHHTAEELLSIEGGRDAALPVHKSGRPQLPGARAALPSQVPDWIEAQVVEGETEPVMDRLQAWPRAKVLTTARRVLPSEMTPSKFADLLSVPQAFLEDVLRALEAE